MFLYWVIIISKETVFRSLSKNKAAVTQHIILINRFYFPDISPTSKLLTDLSEELARGGYCVTVLTSRNVYQGTKDKLKKKEEHNKVRIIRVWSTGLGKYSILGRIVDYMTFYMSVAIVLTRMLTANDAVIAKTDPPMLGVMASYIVRIRKAKLINWYQDIYPEILVHVKKSFITKLLGSLLEIFRNETLRKGAVTIVPGSLMKALLVKNGIDSQSIHVIENWVDEGALTPIAKSENKLLAEWGIRDKFIVAYAGNMGRVHEFATVLEAARELIQNREILFLFIGDGVQRQTIEEYKEEHSLVNILLKDYQSESQLGLVLSIADVHLVTQNPDTEGLVLPSKIYGIMAAARPIIYIGKWDAEVAVKIKQDGVGEAVAIGDHQRLAQLINELYADRSKLQGMGQQARYLAETRYSRDHAINTWKELVESVVKN